MDDGRGQWWPEGSGQGRVSVTDQQQRIAEALEAHAAHVRGCSSCSIDGVDCADAAVLRQAWRSAKTAGAPTADTP